MPLIFHSFLYVVIACFLHIIKMTALESRLLEIQKTINSNSISCENQRAHSLEELKAAEGSLPSPRALVQAVLQKANVNT